MCPKSWGAPGISNWYHTVTYLLFVVLDVVAYHHLYQSITVNLTRSCSPPLKVLKAIPILMSYNYYTATILILPRVKSAVNSTSPNLYYVLESK